MDVMGLMYLLLAKARQQGMLTLERDIENPQESELFSNYPRILADKILIEFITDYMRLMVSGNMNAFEIEALMDEEIETFESEAEGPADSLAMVGDSLPAFGIVAAVMGVVHALASADRPAAELGALIAHAMVGTFLGILLAYGFVSSAGVFDAPKLCRNRQDDAVRENHVAVEPAWLRATNCGRIRT
ncbi:Chemotaxis protein MotA [Hafnia alvei]|uniref:Chemotaxis protein MotA n=1 Tax=Hafnia alvei TaxID=569 RepID=A0A377PJ39_HAFAL|nr:Chemotaxis protein MotA [Hafnia alvei]